MSRYDVKDQDTNVVAAGSRRSLALMPVARTSAERSPAAMTEA